MKNIGVLFALLAIWISCNPIDDQSFEYKIQNNPLKTPWTEAVDPEAPHSQYPRPQMIRGDYYNLNGLWDYAILEDTNSIPKKWDGKILVPYPVESALSGVKKMVGENQALWYEKIFIADSSFIFQDVLLHFGAVDWESQVWLNGGKLGTHRGGYDRFSFDISGKVQVGENTLRVKVWDPTNTYSQPIGKQKLTPGGIFYTPTTGIWQTVWMETVHSDIYIRDLKISPNYDLGNVQVNCDLGGTNTEVFTLQAQISLGDRVILVHNAGGIHHITFTMPSFEGWTPDNPVLYDLKIRIIQNGIEKDVVQSYFGMRKVTIGKDKAGFQRILLNDKYVFQTGMLDQGYWPDGLYTPASEEALWYDLEMTKAMGFNMLRKHVKVEWPDFYHACDRLGILVWQDMPNGDKKISPTEPDIIRTPESAAQFENELHRMIDQHYNHPSIIIWVPFNEGWGQYQTAGIVDKIKSWDSTRLVINTSGWADRGVGDIMDMHHYPDPKMPAPEKNRAIVLGEFGGLGLFESGHTWEQNNWGYAKLNSQADLADKLESFYSQVWDFARAGLSAAVYTQISDVETETNGLMTYDRKIVKVDTAFMRSLNTNQFLRAPLISPKTNLFNESVSVALTSEPGLKIYYTTDRTPPKENSELYQGPFELSEETLLQAISVNDDFEHSRIAHRLFKKIDRIKPEYGAPYADKYAAGGDFALVDGVMGMQEYGQGGWQGFEGNQVDVTVDLGEETRISNIETHFLQDQQAWIFLPVSIEIEVSSDNKLWKNVYSVTHDIVQDDNKYILMVNPELTETARYIRIKAENMGICPDWHVGKGGKTWVFIDEIIVN